MSILLYSNESMKWGATWKEALGRLKGMRGLAS